MSFSAANDFNVSGAGSTAGNEASSNVTPTANSLFANRSVLKELNSIDNKGLVSNCVCIYGKFIFKSIYLKLTPNDHVLQP